MAAILILGSDKIINCTPVFQPVPTIEGASEAPLVLNLTKSSVSTDLIQLLFASK